MHRRRGHGRRSAAGKLLDVVGGEEALLATSLASPPVWAGLVDDFDDLSCGEGEVVRLLKHWKSTYEHHIISIWLEKTNVMRNERVRRDVSIRR